MHKEKVIIFGAGNCGRLIANKLLQQPHVRLLGFVDNDSSKQGITLELSGGGRIMVYASSMLKRMEYDRIIIGTFTGLDEIGEQLIAMGIEQAKIDVSYIELSVKARIAFLQDFAKISQHLGGNVASLGVYRGDFARYINESFRDKVLYLFDTFEGFSQEDVQKDTDMAKCLGAKHFANTSVELVLSKMPYPEQCIIKKGWFPQSAKDLEHESFCFVNLDCDLYEPILAGLRFFYPKMVSKGVILVHEYFFCGYVGVREAVEEFIQDNKYVHKMPIGDNLSMAIIKS